MTKHIHRLTKLQQRRRVMHLYGDGWDESKHPRGDGGRWGTGLGSAVARGAEKAKSAKEAPKKSVGEKLKRAVGAPKRAIESGKKAVKTVKEKGVIGGAKAGAEKVAEISAEKAVSIGNTVKNIATAKAEQLQKAGFSATASWVIATGSAILGGSPASVTTMMTGVGIIGAWGATPGLGAVEGAIAPAIAIGIKRTAEGAQKLDEGLASKIADWRESRSQKKHAKMKSKQFADTDTEPADHTGAIINALKAVGIDNDEEAMKRFMYCAGQARAEGLEVDDALAFAGAHYNDDLFKEDDAQASDNSDLEDETDLQLKEHPQLSRAEAALISKQHLDKGKGGAEK